MQNSSPHASSTSSSPQLEFLLNQKIQAEESSPESMVLLQESPRENARLLLQRLELAERLDAEKTERIQELRQQLKACRLQLRSESRYSWDLLRKIRQHLEAENARLMQSLKSAEQRAMEMRDRNEELKRQAMEMEVQMWLERESAREVLQNARMLQEEENARLLQRLKEDDILIQQMSQTMDSALQEGRARFSGLEPATPQRSMPSPEMNPPQRSMPVPVPVPVPYPDDSGAKPSMVQKATDALNTAIAHCSDSILRFIRTRPLPREMHAQANSPAVANPTVLYRLYLHLEELSKLSINGSDLPLHPTDLNFAVQAYLCSGFTERFEDYHWGLLYNDNNNNNNNNNGGGGSSTTTSTSTSSANSTPQHRYSSGGTHHNSSNVDPKQAFGIYRNCVKWNSSKKVMEKDAAFARVYHEHFVPHILCGSGLLRHDPSIHKSFESDSEVQNSFRKLASSMWMLQKIAFSFVPMAKMIRASGPYFIGDLMVSISEGNKIKDMAGENNNNKSVRFLCVPGFIVRNNIVIKARVVTVS